jgi:hypothetical protein
MTTTIQKRRVPHLVTLDTIEPKEINWLWYPYIPSGTVTAIFGMGGQGKSYMTCDIAARISRGEGLPDQEGVHTPQKVLMLSAEDDYETVLVPRLIKLGADRGNIAVPDFQFTLNKQGADDVRDLMREFAATIVFIDPIVFYAGGKMDMNRSNEVREMMEGLKVAAQESQSSVVIVGHVKKSEEGGEQSRMMGSADWVNAARSGLLVTHTNDGTKIMKHVKTNYGKLGLTRGFEITDDGFVWGDTYEDDDLPTSNKQSRSEYAKDFLLTFLALSAEPASAVYEAAEVAGIAPATLNRAKVGVAESFYSVTAQTFMWRLINADK